MEKIVVEITKVIEVSVTTELHPLSTGRLCHRSNKSATYDLKSLF
jgi:hypothetical protein